MSEEELFFKHRPLVYMAIKQKNLFWTTDDEFQQYVDAGEIGLLKGIRAYDSKKGYKISTYLFKCICNEIYHLIELQNQVKRKNPYGRTISLNIKIAVDEEKQSELIDFIPSEVDIERDFEIKQEWEELLSVVNSLKNEKDKEVIKKFYGLEGRDNQTAREIAHEWGVSTKLIHYRRKRALNELKKLYEKRL